MHVKSAFGGSDDKFTLALAHLFSAPAHHGIVVDRQCLVGDYQIFVDAEHLSETLAGGACAVRVVEVEKLVGRLDKLDAIFLEAFGERCALDATLAPGEKLTLAVAFVECRLGGVGEPAYGVVVVGSRQAVDEQIVVAAVGSIVDLHKLSVGFKA